MKTILTSAVLATALAISPVAFAQSGSGSAGDKTVAQPNPANSPENSGGTSTDPGRPGSHPGASGMTGTTGSGAGMPMNASPGSNDGRASISNKEKNKDTK